MQEEEVHIIMTDQRMPQVSGVELLTKVKAKNPQAVRMLFTGYADLESIIAAINQGHVYQFLKKPWQPEELVDAVRQAAVEYDRLIIDADVTERLRGEIAALQHRVGDPGRRGPAARRHAGHAGLTGWGRSRIAMPPGRPPTHHAWPWTTSPRCSRASATSSPGITAC